MDQEGPFNLELLALTGQFEQGPEAPGSPEVTPSDRRLRGSPVVLVGPSDAAGDVPGSLWQPLQARKRAKQTVMRLGLATPLGRRTHGRRGPTEHPRESCGA